MEEINRISYLTVSFLLLILLARIAATFANPRTENFHEQGNCFHTLEKSILKKLLSIKVYRASRGNQYMRS